MARVLILEPNPELRELFGHVVTRLGHEVVGRDDARSADVVILEPASDEELALAVSLRQERPDVGAICASIYTRGERVNALGPDAYLLKPFTIAQLESVLDGVLALVS